MEAIPLIGKVAVVTGDGSGIGRAACLALARAGAQGVLDDRNRVQAEATAGERMS